MPSPEHDVIAQLLREHPAAVASLLAGLGVEVASGAKAVVLDTALSPQAGDYRADAIVAFRDEAQGGATLVVIVEVQLRPDESKRWSWPVYQSVARARHRADTCVLVIVTRESVAKWASRPVRLGPCGSCFVPLVVSPAAVPRVTAEKGAEKNPALALLSALAHGAERDGGPAAIAALLAAANALEEPVRGVYLRAFLSLASGALWRAMEKHMQWDEDGLEAAFRRRFREVHADEIEEARTAARAEARAEALAQGLAAGLAEGRAEALAQAVLSVMMTRGLLATEDARARIAACRDEALLQRWLARAVTATSVAELFEPEG